ncbi:MAG: 50S ribosomal protein L10 [Kiritimatiellia bacterium]
MSNQKKRPEVIAIYKEVTDFLTGKDFAFLLNFGGLTVTQIADLRRQLAPKQAEMMVIKNTFITKILGEQGITFAEGILTGPTAVITGCGDIAETAKIVVDFVKANELASIKAGLLEKNVLSVAEITTLSELISLAAQQARLLGTLQAPASQMARVLQAKVDKASEEEAPAPTPPPAEGTPAEGTPAV